MRVSELAKELKLSSEDILAKLKSLKLKAQGSDQVLNAVVVSVLRSELSKAGKAVPASSSTVQVLERETKSQAKETKSAQPAVKVGKKVDVKKEAKAAKPKTTALTKIAAVEKKAPSAKAPKVKEAAPVVTPPKQEIKKIEIPLLRLKRNRSNLNPSLWISLSSR